MSVRPGIAVALLVAFAGAGTIWEGAARTVRGAPGLCYVEDSRNIFAGGPS